MVSDIFDYENPDYAYDGLSDDKRRRQQDDDELPNNEERLRDSEWNALYDVTPPNDDARYNADDEGRDDHPETTTGLPDSGD
jgi:hypothetical protein